MPTTPPLTAALLAAVLLAGCLSGCGERTDANRPAIDASASSSHPDPTTGATPDTPDTPDTQEPTAPESPIPEAEPTEPTPTDKIPDDFPLALGMARDDGAADLVSTRGPGLRHLGLCDGRPLLGLEPRDRLLADNGGGESVDARELLLLSSAAEARGVADELSALARSCPSEVREGTRITTELHASPFGESPTTSISRTFTVLDGPVAGVVGRFVHHVVPRGNLLLVTSTYGEWPDASTAVEDTAVGVRRTVAALPTAPDPQASGSTGSTGTATLLEDLDLMAGLPEDGGDYEVRGPRPGGRMIGPVVLCREQVWPTPDVDQAQRLTTTAVGPEHFEGREAVAFRDEASALRATTAFRQAVRSCPRSTTVVVTPLDQDTGQDSVTAGMTYTDGPGSTVLQMTRVGSVVLFVTTYVEGTIDHLPRQAAEVTRTTREIARQL